MTDYVNQNNWIDLFPYLEMIEKGEPLKLNWTSPSYINNVNKNQGNDIDIKSEKTEEIKIRKDFSEFDFEDDSTGNSSINLMRKNKVPKPKVKQPYKTNMDKILKDLMRKKIEEKDEASTNRISYSNESIINSDVNISNSHFSNEEENISDNQTIQNC